MPNKGRLLEGKNCIITSGAHGMGYSIARLFALQGARVAVCGRSAAGVRSGEELAALSPGSFFFQCDMGEADQVKAFADEAIERFGTVDVLVNNVGVNLKQKIKDIDMEVYDWIQRVNLTASVLMLQKVLPNMLDNGIHGSVIHISSMNALSPSPTTAAYSASKGGVISLSLVLSTEVGKYGIRSNVICPGWVATSYIADEVRKAAEEGRSVYEAVGAYDGTSPLMAPGRPSDIANHALFLASDMSSYITGAVIRADGSSVMQAHACEFPGPPQEQALKRAYYDSILEECGLDTWKNRGI